MSGEVCEEGSMDDGKLPTFLVGAYLEEGMAEWRNGRGFVKGMLLW